MAQSTHSDKSPKSPSVKADAVKVADALYENLVKELQLKPMPIDPKAWNNASLD